MKFFSVLIICFACILGCKGKEKKKVVVDLINGEELVEIIRDSSYSSYKKLVNKLGYYIFDSSALNNDVIFVTADQDEETDSNTLTIHMSNSFHVNYLHFSTEDKNLYSTIRNQLIKMGFKQLDSDPFVNEFEMGNLYFMTIKIFGDEKPETYFFTFLRKT